MKKSKKYSTQQKSLKATYNPKILNVYSPLPHSEKTQHKALLNTIMKYVESMTWL